MKRILFFKLSFLLFIQSFVSLSQDTSAISKKRLTVLLASVNTAYVGSMIALDRIWYANNPQSSFHFFNDNNEWLQIDKLGHFTTAFHESVFGVKALKWAGVSEKKAMIWGSLAGVIYQSPIEILDGFSSEYGASWGDLTANTSGSLLVLGQFLLWKEIRFQPKFSFHQTAYANVNPNLLGNGLKEEWLKDYNGQTYWMSFNIYSFLNKDSKFPKWINLSLGYGVENMVSADKKKSISRGYIPYRQYYLSFDFDFSRVKFKRKWIKYVLYPLNFIHIPFPSLEYSKHRFIFHPLYF